jgi:hypothetical protein
MTVSSLTATATASSRRVASQSGATYSRRASTSTSSRTSAAKNACGAPFWDVNSVKSRVDVGLILGSCSRNSKRRTACVDFALDRENACGASRNARRTAAPRGPLFVPPLGPILIFQDPRSRLFAEARVLLRLGNLLRRGPGPESAAARALRSVDVGSARALKRLGESFCCALYGLTYSTDRGSNDRVGLSG